jgi:hypothetical protein
MRLWKKPEIIKTCQTLPNIFATFKGVTQTNKQRNSFVTSKVEVDFHFKKLFKPPWKKCHKKQ